MTAALLGVFVGGSSSRMGGHPKGRLAAPDTGEPLVERLVRLGREAGLEPVLVGDAAGYGDLAPDTARIADDPPGVGPLGGLSALLDHAGERHAVAVACDMPHVTARALAELAAHPADEPVVAVRKGPDAPWEPLLARYHAPRVRPAVQRALARGVRSFQKVLGELEVHAVRPDELGPSVADDWDTPDDCRR
jgi:molybdopterin-guanine dinucleotide biosynthesis protein A